MSSSDSPQVQLVHKWGEGFDKKDISIIKSLLHKDYTYVQYPRSLGAPEQTREEWVGQISEVFKLWIQNDTTIHSIIDAKDKVIVHFTNKIKTSIGVDTVRESIFVSHIVTDGDGSLKIIRTEDFTDSKAHLDFVQGIKAASK